MRLLFCLFLLGFYGYLQAGEIDQLQTKRDVEKFLIRKVNKKFKDWGVFRDLSKRDSTGLSNRFYKLDLDGDGLTDLIINGQYLMVVMDRGKKGYFLYNLTALPFDDLAVKLFAIDSGGTEKKIIVRQHKGRLDTLVYHAGGIMEYNSHPV
jgi:hypothetical protein